MEASGKKFAWAVFVLILYLAMPALRGAGSPDAVAAEPAKAVSPCEAEPSGPWTRVNKPVTPKPHVRLGPCERRHLST